MSAADVEALLKLIEMANETADGHFTLMKFTTNWRACLGTVPEGRQYIAAMCEGATLAEAVGKVVPGSSIYDFDLDDCEFCVNL